MPLIGFGDPHESSDGLLDGPLDGDLGEPVRAPRIE
jgi:hypothetical protein